MSLNPQENQEIADALKQVMIQDGYGDETAIDNYIKESFMGAWLHNEAGEALADLYDPENSIQEGLRRFGTLGYAYTFDAEAFMDALTANGEAFYIELDLKHDDMPYSAKTEFWFWNS
jgi:hypothetical protein